MTSDNDNKSRYHVCKGFKLSTSYFVIIFNKQVRGFQSINPCCLGLCVGCH